MSSAFRECVRLVLDSLGMGEAPEVYLDDVEKLQEAATTWYRDHYPTHGALQLALPSEAVRRNVVMTGNLCDAIPLGWAANDAAHHFISFIDERTGKRCTLLMLQILVILQHATRPVVNASGGKA